MGAYTSIDYLIIVIFIFSILLGLKRGLIKEAISLGTLIVAFIIAMKFSGTFANWLNSSSIIQGMVAWLANLFGEANVNNALSLITLGLSFFILFIITMIIGECINKIASGITLIPGLGLIDHLLGGGFGAIRAFLLSVVVLFLLNLTAVPQSSAWTQSRLVPFFHSSFIWLENIVQPGLQAAKDKVEKALQNVSQDVYDKVGGK